MRIRSDTIDRLELSGPPGGLGTVVLLLVVGVALTAGAATFVHFSLAAGHVFGAIFVGFGGLFGLAILVGGIGTAFTRDRLVLDAVTRSGQWSRRLLGRNLKAPFTFDFDRASSVQIQFFVDSSGSSGGTSIPKVRARLRVTKPRRTIDLDEAEEQREPRVRAIADRVAEMLAIEVRTGKR